MTTIDNIKDDYKKDFVYWLLVVWHFPNKNWMTEKHQRHSRFIDIWNDTSLMILGYLFILTLVLSGTNEPFLGVKFNTFFIIGGKILLIAYPILRIMREIENWYFRKIKDKENERK
jgi:hypothetical protein